MDFKSNQNVQILLKLYNVKRGTLKEISEAIGIRYTTGKIYAMKDFLIKKNLI